MPRFRAMRRLLWRQLDPETESYQSRCQLDTSRIRAPEASSDLSQIAGYSSPTPNKRQHCTLSARTLTGRWTSKGKSIESVLGNGSLADKFRGRKPSASAWLGKFQRRRLA